MKSTQIQVVIGIVIITVVTWISVIGLPYLTGGSSLKPNYDGEKLMEVSVNVMHFYCDAKNCKGEYAPTGNVKEEKDKPKLYEHKCIKCGQIRFFNVKYPYMVYKNKE